MREKSKQMQHLDRSATGHNKVRLCKWVIEIIRKLSDQRTRRLQDRQPIKQLRHSLESFSISNALQLSTAYQTPKRVHFAEPLEYKREFQFHDVAEGTAIEDDPRIGHEHEEGSTPEYFDATETPPRVRRNLQTGLAKDRRIEAMSSATVDKVDASQFSTSPTEDIPSTPITIQQDESMTGFATVHSADPLPQSKSSGNNPKQMTTSYSSIFTMLSDLSPSKLDFGKTFNLGGARFEDDAKGESQQLEVVLAKFETPKKTHSETYGGLSAIYEV